MLTSVSQLVLAGCPCPRVALTGRSFSSLCRPLLGAPAYVQVCRALMIIALLLQLVAIVTSLLGLNCIKIGSTDEQTKAKIATAAGVMAILGGESALLLSCLSECCRGDGAVLAGVSCLVAVSWYANQVVQEFYNPLSGGIKSVPHTLASSC